MADATSRVDAPNSELPATSIQADFVDMKSSLDFGASRTLEALDLGGVGLRHSGLGCGMTDFGLSIWGLGFRMQTFRVGDSWSAHLPREAPRHP